MLRVFIKPRRDVPFPFPNLRCPFLVSTRPRLSKGKRGRVGAVERGVLLPGTDLLVVVAVCGPPGDSGVLSG